ncbi:hypothetical protein Clacol_000294 [Clathrus columnatus]|uniref:Uncharacterized protein n=1 Tax=Clathrus columnatus TaxID=1419009 RepID=A0AAV4ZWX4_9AGAM|nr:hypothetical protein Clacol_000294 [Clathrus columnatus]
MAEDPYTCGTVALGVNGDSVNAVLYQKQVAGNAKLHLLCQGKGIEITQTTNAYLVLGSSPPPEIKFGDK